MKAGTGEVLGSRGRSPLATLEAGFRGKDQMEWGSMYFRRRLGALKGFGSWPIGLEPREPCGQLE